MSGFYVWGGDQPVKTTKDKLLRYSSALGLNELPPAICDAVVVCRGIGLSYLWVDVLCILYDDPEDRIRELAVMSEIYRLSTVTICAASSSGVEHGFLYNRGYFYSARSSPPVRLRFRNKTGGEGVLLAFATENQEDEPDYKAPIEERGWCYQERRLPPRVLYYGLRGLMYTCQHRQMRDRGPYGAVFRDVPVMPRPFEEPSFFTKDWMEIVSNYSRRLLSHPGDKLLACSAVASAAYRASQQSSRTRQQKLSNTYLAGLWKDKLPVGLDWYVPPRASPDGANRELRMRRSKYLAPTWSWAAVDSGVRFWSREPVDKVCKLPPTPSSKVRIISAVANPETTGMPFGSGKDGLLVVKGGAAVAKWVPGADGAPDAISCGDFSFPVHRDSLEEGGDAAGFVQEPLLALRLLRGDVLNHHRGLNCGLVLRRVDKDHCARVGLFYCCREHEHNTGGCGQKFKGFKKQTVKII
ncbi:hypothetical protein KVR01_013853 [Diaporthe batatas]|uniref:uncharacterized protein n=1 Tax=Diaporthe batatas TaxID=748121 RepID=UPI001D04149C|nr:uncharacterized protein KVR01_013853 [Diaporthe batatas]KAG8156274.1 hypothetical protein KVR01_013853 [Diaporthe batatas]